MPDNVNITVNETIENIVINPSISTDVIDINTYSTTENVNISVTPELTTVNINSVVSISPVNSVNGQTGDVIVPTSDNNFTTVLKNKLDGIQAGAEVNVNADWNSTSGDSQILNKPSIPSISGLATVTYVDTQDALKVDKIAGKGLSANDFTDVLKTKLDSVESGAEVNVNADWNSVSGDSQILNKPSIPSIAGLATVTYVDTQDALKVDKVAGSRLITSAEGTILSNTSGVNTGDQDLSGKVDKVAGKDLSTNDYTTLEQTKLAGIADGAEVNVNADWNATTGDAVILNKPTIPSISGLATVTYVDTQDSLKENYLSVPAANGYVLSSTTAGVRSWVAQTGGGGGGGDMLKATYDVDNNGIVDNTEAISIIGRNSTGVTLYKGTIVYILGSTGNRANFVKAQANSEGASAGTFGVIRSDISNNSDGYVTVLGHLDNLDTRSIATNPFTSDTLVDGDNVYLSPTTAGYITNVKPSAPNHLVYIGTVVRTSPTLGTIVYRIQNGFELQELHNVAINGVSNNQLLSYDSATSLWKNKSVTTADIADSVNKRYVTDANLTTIGNQSGINTGDETITTIKSKLGITTLSGSNTGDETTASIKSKLGITTLSGSNTGDQDLSGYQLTSAKDAISGYAGLDGSGKINPSQLPALAITDTFVVASQVAMLALTAEVGDIAVRTDLNKSYILRVTGATTLANWQELLTPTDAVSSVFGRSGTVTAQNGDYTTDQVTETATKVFLTPTEKTAITHTNRASLDLVSGTNTGDETITTIKSKLGITTLSGSNTGDQDLSNLVVKNTAIVAATKTKITYDTKGLVTAGADATTADIADSLNKRYVTDANLVTIGNQSGTNTGDETTSTIKTKLGITTLSGSNTGDNATNTQYSSLVSNATHTGDATGATILTLATVNTNVGTFGTASNVAQSTVNAKGLTTAISNVPIQITQSQVTSLDTNLGLKANLASPTFTGTVVLPSTTSIGTITNTELSYVDGVTSSIQTQLNGKQATLTNPITGTGTTNYLPKFTGASALGNSSIVDLGTTEAMRISSAGNVGIGQDNPQTKLDVVTSGTVQTTILGRGQDGNFRFNTRQDVSTNTDGSVIGELGLDYITTRNSAIRFHRGVSTTGGFVTFTTNDGSERMRVASNGNVGIGTTSPGFPLSLGTGLGNKIALYDASGGLGYGFGIQASLLQIFTNTGSDDISFGYGNSTAFNRNVTFKGGGNVGIGTTSPTSKLQVVGLIDYATNALAIAGGLTVGAFYHTSGVVKVVI